MTELSTHSGQLERWLGREVVEDLSLRMREWYGPPIAVAGVPGKVFAHAGGDFRGRISEGGFATAADFSERFLRRCWVAFRKAAKKQASQMNMPGFTSLSDLISEFTVANKGQVLPMQKVGTTGVVAATNSLWAVGNQPAAGAAGAAAPGGTAHTSANTGALGFKNPSVGGDFTSFINANMVSSVAGNTLLLYDRLFSVAKTMNSTATEAVTGVPTRYQNTTLTEADSIAGNFLFIETATALAATAHNWTVCTYLDQANAASTLPSLTGNASNIINRLDHPISQWFAPLETGDIGIKALTQMQCSALVATGAINFVIGHPIAWMPLPVANLACTIDGVNTAFNLVRIFDSACLAFLEAMKPSTTATTYTGTVTICAG